MTNYSVTMYTSVEELRTTPLGTFSSKQSAIDYVINCVLPVYWTKSQIKEVKDYKKALLSVYGLKVFTMWRPDKGRFDTATVLVEKEES